MEINKEKYVLTKECIGSSGLQLTKYYDFILALKDPEFLIYLEEKISWYTPCNLIGIELFGVMAVSYLKGCHGPENFYLFPNYLIPLFILKKRDHGLKSQLYGEINTALDTFLLDDVITTGKTIEYALDVLNTHHIIPKYIFCIKNRNNLLKINEIKIIEI